ncbi:hypothetical protein Mapa_017212 [Marchantia paleacea]|nr:hypothetical protein Mapa_017212 [Marchantia paleacea]
MSLGLGRQLCLRPRAALTIVGRLHKCRERCSEKLFGAQRVKFHSQATKKLLSWTDESPGPRSTRAAANRRGRVGGETSWDRAAESFFSDGKKASGNEADGGFDRRAEVASPESGAEFGARTRIASYKTKEDDWQSRNQVLPGHDGRDSHNSEGEGRIRVAPSKSREADWQSRNQVPYRQERRERDAEGFSNSRSRSSTGERRGGEGARRDSPSTSSGSLRDGSGSSSRRPMSFRERNSERNSSDRGSGAREQPWQRSASRTPPKDDDFRSKGDYNSNIRVESMSRGYGRAARPSGESRWNEVGDRPRDERYGEADDWRWRAREPTPPLDMEGQAVYGVAPIVSALQACRRTFYTLYMQENLAQNLMTGKRKDKQAVSWIQNKARSLGLTVKEASKHDLNMLVDNRPHQGLVLDASPLELVPIDTLEAPTYDGDKAPVWVALDEITDPQNFGAVLRSAYFLGADGVVVCAKNSAPLSGVVSKASAGALEVMDVQYCRSMVKFLDKSREKGWRVLGGASGASSVPVRDLPRGIATILVLGNEGRGMRTMVKRSCDELVSIVGKSSSRRIKGEYVYETLPDDEDEDEDGEAEGEDDYFERGTRSGAELDLGSGPMAVDSLNVSVAAGILLHELIMPSTQLDGGEFNSLE